MYHEVVASVWQQHPMYLDIKVIIIIIKYSIPCLGFSILVIKDYLRLPVKERSVLWV
jgi:hypothetical protein